MFQEKHGLLKFKLFSTQYINASIRRANPPPPAIPFPSALDTGIQDI
jgi:hypothetical protein